MTDKEAMKLALFALESKYLIGCGAWRVQQDQAITALKERLAQPEQTEVQQLIALVRAQQITIDKLEMALADPMREMQRLGQEIEQEPVAYMSHNKENFVSADDVGNSVPNWTDYYPTPLYATPPPCPTCEALARTVMMDQTGTDA
jgi:hypothetical protein